MYLSINSFIYSFFQATAYLPCARHSCRYWRIKVSKTAKGLISRLLFSVTKQRNKCIIYFYVVTIMSVIFKSWNGQCHVCASLFKP